MRRVKLYSGIMVFVFGVAGSLWLQAGNGNGPNSGSGGNAANNGGGNTIWIYHQHGNGTWSLMQVPQGAISGHAAHGDLWYHSGCPLTGPQDACL